MIEPIKDISVLSRDANNKLNELIRVVNDLEDTVYGCEDDDDAVAEEIQQVVDKVRQERYEQKQRGLTDSVKVVDTKDGLFSDFTAFVAEHPELRFYQAIAAWSGYRSIYGELFEGGLKDTFYERTKEPGA